ncbi:MAG TPA: alpha/beta hydrolase [Jatrophihabitantaceae bacterium]|nr:alpha/beta hydrolase [Jatrophihabitantaceae bacterium]
MPVPLRMAAFWSVYKVLDRRPVFQQPPDKVRKAANRRSLLMGMPLAWPIVGRTHSGVRVEHGRAVAGDGTELRLRIHRPKNAGDGPLPVVVNFHGGGWVSGDLKHSEWWASTMAAEAEVLVISVDYRLAPEHAFPGPAEDCYDATTWIADHADELGADRHRLAVMGDSAGGNLAAVVTLMARDRGAPDIALQLLIYPTVDLAHSYPSVDENANAPILGRKDIRRNAGNYFHNSAGDRTDPYASPLRAKHEGLPPALVQTAQFDPLRDEGAAYAEALRAAGVDAQYTNYLDAVHGYISLPGLVPEARKALTDAIEFVRRSL